jgi:lipopolysaccharide/colanic/teichoic acid biosynthesis glycosyltransferase
MLNYINIKRLFDLIFVLFFSPIILLITLVSIICIKCIEPKFNVFFIQNRIGKNQLVFKIYKLRTMIENDNFGDKALTTAVKDERITFLGKFLRKHRLDEIPQFYNVIKGDMSIVGPRPEQEVFVKKLSAEIPEYNNRHKVLPGITGLAQVEIGYTSDDKNEILNKLKYDLKYINNMSFFMDLKILFKSISIIVFGSGSR